MNCNIIYSQEWAPVGAKWIFTYKFYMSASIDTLVIRSIGDTVIQTHKCKILIKNHTTCDTRSGKEYMYSDSGKVFFYDVSRSDFQMLYNFNAKVGDTIIIFPGANPNNEYIATIIDSVKHIDINSFERKKIYVHYSYPETNWYITFFQDEIIENIGSLWYMFPWVYGACDASWGGPLRCYEDSTIGTYDFQTAPSCDYVYTKINKLDNKDEISILYDITFNQIKLFFKEGENFNYFLYNIYGQLVKSGYSNHKETYINTMEINKGIYLLTIYSDKIVVKKSLLIE